MRLSVVGAGYVGLVTGVCLADRGHDVICADIDQAKVDQIMRGRSPVHEQGLEALLTRNVGSRFRATTDVVRAVEDSDLTLLAVGTPADETGSDLSAVVSASLAVGTALSRKVGYHAVVVKSTVVAGTTDGVVLPALENASGKHAGADFGVGVNPEFLTEGQAVSDFMAPDRLVFGGIDDRTHSCLAALYESFPSRIPRLLTNTRTAEMIKLASNALLGTMISFSNEIANLCAAVGDVDVVDVMRGVQLSRYLTPLCDDGTPISAPISAYIEAGCGFGGSCLPKDLRALVFEGGRLDQPMRVLRAVLETNEAQPNELLRIVERALGDLRAKKVGVLGLAFKPDTDDVRESPTIPLVHGLISAGAEVTIHDPVVRTLPPGVGDLGAKLSPDLDEVLESADALVIVTQWEHYLDVPRRLAAVNPSAPLIDGRRMIERDRVRRYLGIGVA
jgi:UDPglucose 6-dehydrogenase